MHSSLLLAFSFATPWLLWGLALGAAPVIIHLLNRRKFKEVEWAAMRFLLQAVRKNSQRMRIEQLLLLLVRTLILILLALALAQPLVEQLGAFFQPSQPAHKLIVIDASLSMGFQARDQSLFDRARDVARRISEAGRQGDAFNLVRLSNIPPSVIVATPAYQGSKVIEEIEQMQLPHGRANLADCLQKTVDLLKAAPDLPRKEIYILSDFQRVSWTPESAEELGRIKTLLKRLSDAGRLVLIDLGNSEASNLAVTRFEAQETFVTVGRTLSLRASIHNYGLERVTGRGLEFLVDDRLIEQRSVDVNAGAEILETFSHAFSQGGEHRLQVRLQKDGLPFDNQRWLAVPVKERVRVLCVNGRPGGLGLGRATDFLELALSPQNQSSAAAASGAGGLRPAVAAGLRSPGLIEPQVVNEGELQSLDLSQYDCVFLCDVRMFTEREATLLDTYVRGGGGVIWSLGPQVQADNYNQTLYRGGEGILPAKLGDRVGDLAKGEDSFNFDPADFTHPIINPFQGNPDAGLETTRTYNYIRAKPAEGSWTRVALRFDSGDPAILDASIGRGRSLLITTALDDQWGVWPLWPSFVPLVHEIVQYAVSGRWSERQRLVGEALSAVFPAAAVDVDIAVTRPDGSTHPVRVTPSDELSQFTYEGTGQSGMYEVVFAHPLAHTELFAVNVDPRESNLAKYTQEELGQDLLSGIDFDYDVNWQDLAPEPIEGPAAPQGGLTRWLLYATLYLLFAEQLLAWDFRIGLCALCPVLIPVYLLARGKKGARGQK